MGDGFVYQWCEQYVGEVVYQEQCGDFVDLEFELLDYYEGGEDCEDLLLCVGYELQCVIELVVLLQDYFFGLWVWGFELWIGEVVEQCDQCGCFI